jgi:hypothetical protein
VAKPVILTIPARLRSREPLDPRTVGRVKLLIGDRSGPCYRPRSRGALAVALREISDPPGLT